MTRPVSEILEELTALREKATDGPWVHDRAETIDIDWIDGPEAQNICDLYVKVHEKCIPTKNAQANAALIVALVNAFPALREEIERLMSALQKIAEAEKAPDPEYDEYGFEGCHVEGYNDGLEVCQSIARRTLKGDDNEPPH